MRNKASLTRHNKCKDCGSEILRFSDYFNSIINTAYGALGFVIRNINYFKKIDSVVRLFNCLVRPHLEYAAVVWWPQTEVNINHIEKIQKIFLRYTHYDMLNGKYGLCYYMKLHVWTLKSLSIHLKALKMWMYRKMLTVSWIDKITKEEL